MVIVPKTSCGPYRFGISREDLDALPTSENEFEFNSDGILSEIILRDTPEKLIFKDNDLMSMSLLDVALFLASHSKTFGQAQGGSLYFNDLGIALLQFESRDARSIAIFSEPHNEPLMRITAKEITEYYNEQNGIG